MQPAPNENWMPLESNPEVINAFILKMGLKTDLFSFQELLSTEQWALEMIPKPVLGIIFLFEETPVQEAFKHQQNATLKLQQVPADCFFMKQKARNACGTIALFHIVLNAMKHHPEVVLPGSYLDKFSKDCSAIDPSKRGDLFKENKEILTEHQSAVHGGQSHVQNECNSHFIAFVPFNGHIYELDGCKKCPVDHGVCDGEDFLTKGTKVIQDFISRDPDNNNFSMIALAKTHEP